MYQLKESFPLAPLRMVIRRKRRERSTYYDAWPNISSFHPLGGRWEMMLPSCQRRRSYPGRGVRPAAWSWGRRLREDITFVALGWGRVLVTSSSFSDFFFMISSSWDGDILVIGFLRQAGRECQWCTPKTCKWKSNHVLHSIPTSSPIQGLLALLCDIVSHRRVHLIRNAVSNTKM